MRLTASGISIIIFSNLKSLHIHKRSPWVSSEKQQTSRPWGRQLGQQSFSCEACRVPTSIKNKYNKELLKRTIQDWKTSVFAQLLSCSISPDSTATVTAGRLHSCDRASLTTENREEKNQASPTQLILLVVK